MPALVNIRVGSLRGTSGDDGTISWPFFAKKSRNVDLISLTPLMFIQSQSCPESPQMAQTSGETLLDKACRGVQKLFRRIIALPQHTRAVDRGYARVDRLGTAVFPSYLFETVTSGEIGLSAGAEGATAPETLRQTDRVT